MKIFFLMLMVFILLSNIGFSENNQMIIPIDSDIYTALKTLYLEQGLSIPSTSAPYSIDEIIWTLGRIDYNSLSQNGKNTYDYISEELKNDPLYKNEDRISFNTRLNVNLESYIHTNKDFTQWQYGYEERLPILNSDIELWLFENTYAFMGTVFQKEMFVVEGEENNYTNLLFDFNGNPFLLDGGSFFIRD